MKSLLTILSLLSSVFLFANTIIVAKDKPVSTLRQAIELARNGDTILLTKGVYKEGNIIIRKSICLKGIGTPVLDGNYKNEILTISGHDIVIKGIHFANAG